MNPDVYKFDISRATRAVDLHTFRREIVADDELHSTEKDELLRLIDKRFGQLNARTTPAKGRWD